MELIDNMNENGLSKLKVKIEMLNLLLSIASEPTTKDKLYTEKSRIQQQITQILVEYDFIV